MQENHLYEYAVIRVVPKVEREEFLNVGVVLYCKKPAFLQAKTCPDQSRLLLLYPEIDIQEIELHLRAFRQICSAEIKAGPIAALDAASRFSWLTARRSTMLQTSVVHPGLCKDPAYTLAHLYDQLVNC